MDKKTIITTASGLPVFTFVKNIDHDVLLQHGHEVHRFFLKRRVGKCRQTGKIIDREKYSWVSETTDVQYSREGMLQLIQSTIVNKNKEAVRWQRDKVSEFLEKQKR